MRNIFILFLLLPFFGIAQQGLYVTIFAGAANYEGDLRNQRFSWDQSQPAFGAGFKYDFSAHLAARTGICLAKIEADDQKNIPSLRYRNLTFQSKIVEWNAELEYSILNFETKHFSPYMFVGVGVFHFNPFTFDSSGQKFYLQPMGTEGQGLPEYPDRKPYELTQFNIPFGGGIKIAVTDNLMVGYEIGFRKLFTDYLDDVSLSYADKAILLRGRGPKVVELAYRAGELKNGNPNYPSGNLQRGKGELKDWYYFQGIFVSIDMNAFSHLGIRSASNADKGRVTCPRRW